MLKKNDNATKKELVTGNRLSGGDSPGPPQPFQLNTGGDRERADRPLEGPLPPDDFLRFLFVLFFFVQLQKEERG